MRYGVLDGRGPPPREEPNQEGPQPRDVSSRSVTSRFRAQDPHISLRQYAQSEIEFPTTNIDRRDASRSSSTPDASSRPDAYGQYSSSQYASSPLNSTGIYITAQRIPSGQPQSYFTDRYIPRPILTPMEDSRSQGVRPINLYVPGSTLDQQFGWRPSNIDTADQPWNKSPQDRQEQYPKNTVGIETTPSDLSSVSRPETHFSNHAAFNSENGPQWNNYQSDERSADAVWKREGNEDYYIHQISPRGSREETEDTEAYYESGSYRESASRTQPSTRISNTNGYGYEASYGNSYGPKPTAYDSYQAAATEDDIWRLETPKVGSSSCFPYMDEYQDDQEYMPYGLSAGNDAPSIATQTTRTSPTESGSTISEQKDYEVEPAVRKTRINLQRLHREKESF